MSSPTIVSSPGKVLVAGGYLVLDPAYSGLVISTSSRFYTVVQSASHSRPNQIHVRSPQFLDAEWQYSVSFEDGIVVKPVVTNTSTNKFVELALQSTIAVVVEIGGQAPLQQSLANGIDIDIVGDNDFYSQRAKLESLNLTRTLSSLSKIPPFCAIDVKLSDVEKTGLGSSAALITSLVAALLIHLSGISPTALSEPRSEGRHLVHNVSQYVHCMAQGKIGSGFDVSAAVYGSQRYTRFDPKVLQDVMDEHKLQTQLLLTTLAPSNRAWKHRVEPFKLPPLTRIMLADVGAGSNTPSLVSKVLKWRKEEVAAAQALWTAIDHLNQSLANTLLALSALYSKDQSSYTAALKYVSSLQAIQWTVYPGFTPNERSVVETLYEVYEITQAIRGKMREMGHLAGVPIEPPEQTVFLDACVSQAGVIGGGVPGAGGYDAVWLLLCEPVDCSPDLPPVDRVEHMWSNWKGFEVSPLTAVESTELGARVEDLDAVPGLKAAISRS